MSQSLSDSSSFEEALKSFSSTVHSVVSKSNWGFLFMFESENGLRIWSGSGTAKSHFLEEGELEYDKETINDLMGVDGQPKHFLGFQNLAKLFNILSKQMQGSTFLYLGKDCKTSQTEKASKCDAWFCGTGKLKSDFLRDGLLYSGEDELTYYMDPDKTDGNLSDVKPNDSDQPLKKEKKIKDKKRNKKRKSKHGQTMDTPRQPSSDKFDRDIDMSDLNRISTESTSTVRVPFIQKGSREADLIEKNPDEKYVQDMVKEVVAKYKKSESMLKQANKESTLQRPIELPQTEIEELLQSCKRGSKIEFVSKVIQMLVEVQGNSSQQTSKKGKRDIRPVLQCVSRLWEEEHKNRLVHMLAASDFFGGSYAGFFFYLTALEILEPHRAIVLLNPGNILNQGNFFEKRSREVKNEAVAFLVSMMELTTDARLRVYEGLPFYSLRSVPLYPKRRQDLISLIYSFCTRLEICPPENFFSMIRQEYIQELKEKFIEGSITLKGAAVLLRRHVGNESDAKEDCLLWLIGWPELNQEMQQIFRLYRELPKMKFISKAITKRDTDCQSCLHPKGNDNGFDLVDVTEEGGLTQATEACGQSNVVYVATRATVDPRKPSAKAAVIVFKTPTSPVFIYIRKRDAPESLMKLFKTVAKKNVVSLTERQELKDQFKAEFHIDLEKHHSIREICVNIHFGVHGLFATQCDAMLAHKMRYDGLQSLARFTWGTRFCMALRNEYHEPPLSEAHRRHLLYELRLCKDFVTHLKQMQMDWSSISTSISTLLQI